MKNFKYLFILMLAVLAGCSTQPETQDISGEITVVTSYIDAEEKFADVEAGFMEMYPEVTGINWESTAGDYDEYITTRMTSGDYGDVLLVPFSLTRTLDQLPAFLAPLGDQQELAKKWTFTDQAAYDGQTYAMPISVNALGMMYNTDVFTEASVEIPTSTEELYAACEAIVSNGKTCWYSNLNTIPALWSGALTSYGGENYQSEMLEVKTAVQPGQPYREVLDLIYGMISKGYTEADPMTADVMTSMQQVANGDAGFIIMGSQSLADLQSMATSADKIKMAPFPVTYDGKQHMALGPDELIGVSNKSDNQATAKAFVEYLISSESGFAYDNGGFAPEVDGNESAPESIAYLIEDYDTYRSIASEDAETTIKFNEIGNAANMASMVQPIGELLEVATNGGDYDEFIKDLEERWQAAVLENE